MCTSWISWWWWWWGGAASNWGQSETCLLSVMEASRSNTFHRCDLTVSQSVTPPPSLLLLPFNPSALAPPKTLTLSLSVSDPLSPLLPDADNTFFSATALCGGRREAELMSFRR